MDISNMRIMLRFFVIVLIIANFSCTEQVHYLDDDYPDLTPKKYAEGIVNIKDRYLQNISMSPDGREILLGETDSLLWRYERILRIKVLDNNQVVTDTPEFVKNFKYERMWMIGEPMISPDNQNLYFVADYPPDYWHAKRTEHGDWSVPVRMESLSTDEGDWYMSASKNNTLYFTNGRIYRSPRQNDSYSSRIKVEGAFNQQDAGDPCISPHEDYMVFASTREGGCGQGDIYVCFKDKNGKWTQAFDLGKNVNTAAWESAPFISPDEKYLFFSRRDTGQHAKYQDIYWVNMDIIDNIKNEQNLR